MQREKITVKETQRRQMENSKRFSQLSNNEPSSVSNCTKTNNYRCPCANAIYLKLYFVTRILFLLDSLLTAGRREVC